MIGDETALRSIIEAPTERVKAKVSDHLNELTRQFIDLSPFLCLATSGRDGTCDVSPRGDPPGFVRILDDRRLLIPERPGNRLADSLQNVLGNPNVGLLFFIPGVSDTLRVNGRAAIVDDPELLKGSEVEGKQPKLALVVEIDEVFTHCSKAFLRAQLWDPTRYVDRGELPSGGTILQSLDPTIDGDEYDAERAERYARREGFY
jgi:PPOX class probable FMN-dependent enzyme